MSGLARDVDDEEGSRLIVVDGVRYRWTAYSLLGTAEVNVEKDIRGCQMLHAVLDAERVIDEYARVGRRVGTETELHGAPPLVVRQISQLALSDRRGTDFKAA